MVKGVCRMGFADAPRHRASTEAVLDFAWDAGPFRADHVIAALGLTRSTALTALDTLIDIGLIRELPSASPEVGSRMGRPARHFELRGDAGVVVGIDAGAHRFTAVVADLAGQPLAQESLAVAEAGVEGDDLIATVSTERRRESAFAVIDAALVSAGRQRADVIGVAIGVPAPVDADGRSPAHQAGFWQHMNAGLQHALASDFPVVRVENDGALAAVAEGTLGAARGCDDFIAMLVGHRLGSGVFLGGRLVRGAHGGVGELEAFSYVSGVDSADGFGLRADRWLRAALDDGLIPADHPWSRLAPAGLTAAAVLAEARVDDPVARPLLEELGGTLGRICSVVGRFYDPEVIVVCGAMAGALGGVLEIAQRYVHAQTELPAPEIVASELAGDVVSLGAVSAAREAALEIVLPLLTERRLEASAD